MVDPKQKVERFIFIFNNLAHYFEAPAWKTARTWGGFKKTVSLGNFLSLKMSQNQKDLFIFGAHGRKPLKELVTPHKVSLLALIFEYCQTKRRQLPLVIFGETHERESTVHDEREKREFMMILLRLLQSPDIQLKDLLDQIQPVLNQLLIESFEVRGYHRYLCAHLIKTKRLKEFYGDGILPFMDFFQDLSMLLKEPEHLITGTSVLGLFVRRQILAFDQLSFSQVTKLFNFFREYYEVLHVPEAFDDCDNFGGSLVDSITSLPRGTGRLTLSALGKSVNINTHAQGDFVEDGIFYSHKQAEYFISRQGFLLQHNEQEALSPSKLQGKITDMLQANPDITEAHFLSFLNSLRVKEYCTALHNIYHYFDRNVTLGGGDSKTETGDREEDIGRRYAALNLAALHFRFGHRKEALAALQEAISMAQEKNDHVCLQHALSWLHRIEESSQFRISHLMARSVAKSGELSLPNITSLGIQSLAKQTAFSAARPANVFDFLLKSDILNCQHSQSHFMCVSYAQKSALWKMYGKRELSSMCSQVVLNLDTADSGIYHDGEAVCLAMCEMASQHAQQGFHQTAQDILNSIKQRFPPLTQFAPLWMICEQEINFDRAILTLNWATAEQAVTCLKGLDSQEAQLREAILNKEKGDITTAESSLKALIEKTDQLQPDFMCRVLLVMCELCAQTGNTTSALAYVLDCVTQAKGHNLQYLCALASVHLAFVQLLMKLPHQALDLLNSQMIQILGQGDVYNQARALYCHAKCHVAASSLKSDQEKKTALLQAVSTMDTVIEKFQKLDASFRLKDAYYYQARLYNELGYNSERNRCAHQFKKLDQEYPTISKTSVCIL